MTEIVRESESTTGSARVPVYTDAATVRSKFSEIEAAASAGTPTIDDPQIDQLIIMAESIVDNLVGWHVKYHSKFNEGDSEYAVQHTKFPRDVDFNISAAGAEAPYIPWEIEEASLIIVEALYAQFYNTNAVNASAAIPAELQEMLQYGGSVKIHDFAFTVGASKSTGSSNVAAANSSQGIKDWLTNLPKGRYAWSLINQFTNFTGQFE